MQSPRRAGAAKLPRSCEAGLDEVILVVGEEALDRVDLDRAVLVAEISARSVIHRGVPPGRPARMKKAAKH